MLRKYLQFFFVDFFDVLDFKQCFVYKILHGIMHHGIDAKFTCMQYALSGLDTGYYGIMAMAL